jgi:flagellin
MNTLTATSASLVSANTLSRSQEMLGRSLARLSSGSRIASPAEDAAGLAVSDKMDSQHRRLQAASTNVQNAVSLVQTTDGFLANITKVVSRMSELSTLSQDVTATPADVDLYAKEFRALQDQLRSTIGGPTTEIGGSVDVDTPVATFNGIELFAANPNGTTITIGAESSQTLKLPETNLRSGPMLTLIAQDSAGAYTADLRDAGMASTLNDTLSQIATARADLGGSISRLEIAAGTLTIEQQNVSAAVSRIRDVDVAAESTQLAKYNILVQSSTAMLAQSNQRGDSVLKLLQS